MMKPGDRAVLEGGEEVVITQRRTTEVHNFGPASARDVVLYTSERPGGGESKDGNNQASTAAVPEWVAFVKERGVTNVLVLLEHDELDDGTDLLSTYRQHGMTAYHVPANSDPQAARKILQVLRDVEAKQERIVAHCTHGMGRSGRICAFWLCQRYGLSAEDAVEEVLETARQHGVERMGAPGKLKAWMG